MKVDVMAGNLQEKTESLEVSEHFLGCPFNEPLVHQIVTACMANVRAGTKAQKTRAEVRGGGIKPWKQKGTGRARAGSIRSPLWRKGGVIFAAEPRSYKQKMNKKMYRGAMKSILSELFRQERLVLVDALHVEAPRTKHIVQLLKPFENQKVVFVTDEFDFNLYLSSRNIPYVDTVDVSILDPVSLVGADRVIMTVTALKTLEGMFV
jgi:large subunit ribosomal protein L4